uniref:Uncharacterized protein n=1 Tax=Avena sativa TaxID=4498 RepID=A0ACD5W6Z7_AVESA
MVLAMNCFGAPGAEQKVSPASKQLGVGGAEAKEQRAVAKEEASTGHAASEAKRTGGDRVKLAGKEEGKKKSGAPILTHHFPFQSRPGLERAQFFDEDCGSRSQNWFL